MCTRKIFRLEEFIQTIYESKEPFKSRRIQQNATTRRKTLNLPFVYCPCRHANCDTENGVIAESWRHQRRSRRVFRVLDSIESKAIQDVLVPQCESQISTGMFARCRSETVCETAMENLTFFYLSCLAVGCREDFAILNALNATKPRKATRKTFLFFHLKSENLINYKFNIFKSSSLSRKWYSVC